LAKGLVKKLDKEEKLTLLVSFLDKRIGDFPSDLKLEFEQKLNKFSAAFLFHAQLGGG
jgi:hypothetical protein